MRYNSCGTSAQELNADPNVEMQRMQDFIRVMKTYHKRARTYLVAGQRPTGEELNKIGAYLMPELSKAGVKLEDAELMGRYQGRDAVPDDYKYVDVEGFFRGATSWTCGTST